MIVYTLYNNFKFIRLFYVGDGALQFFHLNFLYTLETLKWDKNI